MSAGVGGDDGDLLVDRRPRLLRIVLDREGKRNAITPSMAAKGIAAIRDAEADPDCRCIVITGTGGSFSAGADLSYALPARDQNPLQRYLGADAVADLVRVVDECSIPVVAAVNGWALGGGIALAAASTFVLADAEAAVFGMPEAGFGVFPFVLMPFVAARVGASRATLWAMTAEHVSADQAWAAGLVDRTVPHASFDQEVDAFVDLLTERDPAVLRAAARWASLARDTGPRADDHARALSYLFAAGAAHSGPSHPPSHPSPDQQGAR